MALTEFVCPQCRVKGGSAKAIPAGALIRCPKCTHVFHLGGDTPATPPTSPPSPASPVRRDTPSSAPRREPPALARSATPPESPRSSRVTRKPAESNRATYDDDGKDDDRPRRKKKKAGGNSGLYIGLAAGVALVFVLVTVLVVVFAFGGNKGGDTQVAGNNSPRELPGRGGFGAGDPHQPVGGFQGGPAEPATNPRNNPTPPTNPDPAPPDSGLGQMSSSGSGSVQDIYQYVLKSTAWILNLSPKGISSGTGAVVDANERLILTNYHVVANNQELVVFFPVHENGKPVAERERYLTILKEQTKNPQDLLRAEVIATDTQRDLALIRVPKLPPGTETLPLAKGVVNIGQTVHSIGNPGASGALWVYTQGAVRAVYRKKWKAGGGDLLLTLDSEVVETQSPTNPGDSGGPLVNDRGELVGVTEGGSVDGSLLSVFISLGEARDFIEREYSRKFGKAWSPVARAALRLRSGGGADVTSLIGALDHKDAKTRASAARSLGEMGADAKLAIRRLVTALKDSDELTSRVAAEALSKIGAPGRDDVPTLLTALRDPKLEVRLYVAGAIGQIGPDAASSAGQLAQGLADANERVRESVVRSLGSLGPNAKAAAIPELTKALADNSKEVRVAAAAALTNLMTPPVADDVPLLVTILKHQDPEAGVFGARALAKLGKQAKSAIPDLLEAVKSSDAAIRRGAIDTLAAIGPDVKTALPVYLAALKDATDVPVRQSALLALGQLGKELDKDKDKNAIAAVLDAAQDPEPQVKKAALTAVGKLGAVIGAPGAKLVMPALIEGLQAKESDVRDHAMETVSGLGPLARDAIPTLITMMEKQDVKLFKNATNKIFIQDADDAYLDKIAKTLGKIGQPAVRPLLRGINTSNLNFGLLIGSCRALGEVGPPAKEALPALAQISGSLLPPPVCFEADRALRKIRTK